MKIDTHQHYWHYQADDFPWISEAMPSLQRNCCPTDCKAALEAAGVQAPNAVQARAVAAETEFLLRTAAHNPEVLGVIGWADLGGNDLAQQLDGWCAEPAFKGLRHILQDEPDVGCWAAAASHNRGLRLLQKHRRVYEILVFHHQMPSVIEFCARHDAHWLVLDHAGKPPLDNRKNDRQALSRWDTAIHQLACMPHVVCKLSGLVTETEWQSGAGLSAENTQSILACFDTVLGAFGPDRLMFGSDWPVCELAAPYAQVHALAHTWARSRLTALEQAAFWGETAMRCYGLKPPSKEAELAARPQALNPADPF